ncbi:MSCRAMM family protein [Mycoplasma sp. P36-A1]|uniref:MSCRAMM family protein n=1 Tax=Mycoplasma sp. P36-A1 TaxID=3252900 RepID=UPI003C2BB6A6
MKKLTMLILLLFYLITGSKIQASIKTTDDGFKTTNGWSIKRIVINNKLAFCIQPGLNAGTSSYSRRNFASNYSGISNAKKRRIEVIGLSATKLYNEAKANNNSNYIRIYYAAQELIWDEISNKQYRFTINLTSHRNNINNRVNEFNKNLEFSNKTYNIRAGSNLVLNDSNLKDWVITNLSNFQNQSGLKITKTNNSIRIENPINNNKNITTNLNLMKHNELDKDYTFVYLHNVLQDYVLVNYENVLTNNVTFTTQKGQGKIAGYKINESEEKLENAHFGVYLNNALIDTMISNKEGYFESKLLDQNTYIIKEIKAPTNHYLDTTEYTVNIKINETVYINENKPIVNQFYKGLIKVVKYGQKQSKYGFLNEKNEFNLQKSQYNKQEQEKLEPKPEPLAKVKYEIYQDTKLIQTLTTNEEGIAISQKLRTGIYQVKEIKTLENYLLDDTVYEVEVLKDKIVQINNDKPIVNVLEQGGFKLIKKDEHNTLLNNIEFSLFNSEDILIAKYYTDKNGVIEVDNLLLGKYYLQESNQNPIYISNNNKYPINIEKHQQIIALEDIINYYQKHILVINKLDIETEVGLENAVFKVIDKHQNEQILKSDKQGKIIIEALKNDCFSVSEITPPPNYLLNENNTQEVCLENDNNIKFLNSKITDANLILKKVDFDNNKPIPNTQFTIIDKKKKESIHNTDENGMIQLKLEQECFVVKETKAAVGYFLEEKEEKICIENKPIEKTYTNKQLKILETGTKTKKALFGYAFILISLTYTLFKRIFRCF